MLKGPWHSALGLHYLCTYRAVFCIFPPPFFFAMKILIVNGPNLNRLGTREPDIYGHRTMADCMEGLRRTFSGIEIEEYQSNVEGFLIDRLQQADQEADGIVLNAGAYTHTSIALADCIRSLAVPVVEVHISNVHAREDYRRQSMIASVCMGVICGFGLDSYRLAVEALVLQAANNGKSEKQKE